MGPLAKSLAENEKSEERREDQGLADVYDDESLVREQMLYPQ